MRTTELDASGWNTVSDFYDALLLTIGAPAWHGRSIDALIDSMVYEGINALEAPYAVTIVNVAKLSEPLKTEVRLAAKAIQEAREDRYVRTGEDVTISLDLA
jgi:RNAse (barnase) inhibitor barstar